MQASSLVNLVPAGLPVAAGGVPPFLPPVQSSPQPLLPQGGFFPHFIPPRLPPPPHVIPGANLPPFLPPPQFIGGGPVNQNFSVNPQFPPAPPQWQHYCGRPHNKNKHTRHHRKPRRENPHSGSTSGQTLFVCSPCHKEYKSRQTYDIHLATHIKCSKCDFESSKGAMHEHELMHYLPPELNFSSQEDITKWREERKKNFPTAANVLKKKQLQDKRERQGDVVDTPLYRYVSRVCGAGDRGFSWQRGGKRNHWVVGTKRGRSQHGREWVREREGVSQRPPWKQANGRRGRRYNRNRKDKEGCGLEFVSAKKPTLLEKLLAREIRTEQNALLQCIRYIVRNNFFRPNDCDGQSPAKASKSPPEREE